MLVNRSILNHKKSLEDVIVSIDSWEYSTNILVLQTKSQFNGYPLIFGRPWLTTIDAYIGSKVGNMTVTNGLYRKYIVIYHPTQPLKT